MEKALTEQGHVQVVCEDRIAVVEFFHPMSNSLPGNLLDTLVCNIEALGNDNSVRVIILKSAGDKAFCAGASFDELLAIDNEKNAIAFFSGFAKVINAARKCPKFILGRVHGKAVGGGVGMAASVDFCFAHSSASVKLSELAVGIGPFVVGPAIERKMGLSAMSQLAINASEWYPAAWAKDNGLYAEVFDTIAEMDEALMRLAKQLAGSNPEAMAEMKKIFWQGTEHWDELLPQRAAISGRLVLSDFSVKAISAFKKK